MSQGEDYSLFSEASPASAVYSHLRLQLPESQDPPLADDPHWPEGLPADEDSDTLLPMNTSFLIPRQSTSNRPRLDGMEGLQVNTMFCWTAEQSTLAVWRRNVLEIQRDWMSSFNDLASLAQARFQDPALSWWPYHLLAVDLMAHAADKLIDRLHSECYCQDGVLDQ